MNVFGTGLPDLGAAGRKCPMPVHCSSYLCQKLSLGPTDDRALLHAKYATYSVPAGFFLYLQHVFTVQVSITDVSVTVFATGTN
jgi:hypothetical protein